MAQPSRYTPATPAEVQQVIAEALLERRSLEVCAGGSKRRLRAPIGSAAVLDMSAVAGITDYDPEELVVTARAGTPLAELEAALAGRQQMLAFEPFDHAPLFGAAPGRATLGGVVAGNVSGPRRLAIGAARDHILGFTAVSGRGERLKGGGAVVKNVTGFDLPKLMAGSWGTLAVLISITMRVLPRPRAERTLVFKGLSGEAAHRLMSAAMATPASVSAAAHLHGPKATTALRVEGFGPSVDVRCRELLRMLQPPSGCAAIEAEESSAFWRGVSSLDALPVVGHVLWRISVPPSRGWEVESQLACEAARYVSDWAGALVWAAVPEAVALAECAKIRAVARSLGGHAILIRAPLAMRTALGVGADRDPALARLQARVKAAFDPCGILNPGLDPAADH
jgi:glycolate oxidase FAD binding subunit